MIEVRFRAPRGVDGMSATPTVYELHIPELARPFRSILPCPEILKVAWHRDALGIHELLAAGEQDRYQDDLWQVRSYRRAVHYPEAREAFYEEVPRA